MNENKSYEFNKDFIKPIVKKVIKDIFLKLMFIFTKKNENLKSRKACR